MSSTENWAPVEGNVEDIVGHFPCPFDALQSRVIPAVIVRQAFNPKHCIQLVERFSERNLIYNPRKTGDGTPHRVDIGTSLGKHATDPDKFFAHSEKTHTLFQSLFNGFDNPVQTIYDILSQMLPNKRVMTAQEADGRRYGPAIFRTYYEGLGHNPHYDSVSKRSKRYTYTVSRFQHQFAGVLCFQNSDDNGETGEGIIYRTPWTPDLQVHITQGTFQQYVAKNGIERVKVHLNPGDLYFFYSENLHEVPSVVGKIPRLVLATFIGMSPNDNEVFLWS